MAPKMKKEAESQAESSFVVSSFAAAASSTESPIKLSPQLQAYLESGSIISEERTPFLALNAPQKAHAVILDGDNFPRIQKGDIVNESDFSQTFHVAKLACQATVEKYSVKYLHPKVDEQPSVHAFEAAVSKLVVEALYLASLEHEFVLKLHGFSLGQYLDSVFLLTDGISETLEHRMETWKRKRKERQESKTPRSVLLESLEMDLSARNLNRNNANADPNAYQVAEQDLPDDLVALQTNYALQILQAIEYLHERGIVIRDLRPSNIGFKHNPEQHTVQLFELGSCHEVLSSSEAGQRIPPEDIKDMTIAGPVRHSAPSRASLYCDSSSSTDNNNIDSSRHTSSSRHTASSIHNTSHSTNRSGGTRAGMRNLIRNRSNSLRSLTNTSRHGKANDPEGKAPPRANPMHYRAPESYTEVNPLTDEATVSPQPDSSVKKHIYTGYDTKADLYSWSMIYYEMLAEGRPYNHRALLREGHYYKVQALGHRPSLQKLHFPRTIKAVLTQAWDPVLSKRATAQQLCGSLGKILDMLEGHGLPWKNATTNTIIDLHASSSSPIDSVPKISRLSLDSDSFHSTRSTSTAITPPKQQLSLPERAASLMTDQSRYSKGWVDVWDQRGKTQKLDTQKVVEALSHQNHKNAEKKKSKPKEKKTMKNPLLQIVARGRKLIPFDAKAGMVRNERNDAAARRLLGANYDKHKK